MTLRELFVSLGYEVDRNSERQAESSIKGLKNLAGKLLGAIGIGLSISGITNLVEAAADVEALQSQFSQVFGEMEEDAQKKLEKIADDTGVNVNRMKGSFTQIAAFAKTTGIEEAQAMEIADRSMKAVADSAAFYDRSIEDATESLQSFLKGNFENDAALGLSCTETTRNAAANALYGKSFKDLSEAQKQLTLLQMVEDANKASGALGQAARESDTWTNQMGNLKQSLQDLKAALGKGILKPAVSAVKMLNLLVQKATEKISEFTSETGQLTKIFDRLYALIKRLQPSAERFLSGFSKWLSKGIDFAKRLIDRLGGTENAIKLLLIVLGAIWTALNADKILGFMKTFVSLGKGLKGIFSGVNLKIMAIVAVIVVLALIVEDFINFMLGNDSVIGTIFDKMGIDAEAVRDTVRNAWDNIKKFLAAAWEFIKSVGTSVFEGLKTFWQQHGEQITGMFSKAWNLIVNIFSRCINYIANFVKVIFKGLSAFWNTWGSTIMTYFQTLWNTLCSLVQPFLDVVDGIITFLDGVFSGNWEQAWEGIKQIFMGVLQFIYNFVTGILNAVFQVWSDIFQKIYDFVSGILDNVITAVSEKITSIKESIVEGFEAAIEWITGLPDKALEWGADIINGIVDGIKGAIGNVRDAAKEIADNIKSYLHFSVPDEGPLTDYQTWMPDMMKGLADGISGSEDVVLNKVRNLAAGIRQLMQAATASVGTATMSTINNTTSNMTQNVNINNSYSGGSIETQKNVSRAMKKSAVDATTYMARGLAYARG